MAILRVIRDGARTGEFNMRRDAELLAEHRPGDAPILRLYRWEPAAITIGYHQDDSDFDAEAAARDGLDIVRRPTGGRAILHAEELTYSLTGTSPGPLFGESLHTSYELINRALLRFLRSLGIEADVSDGESRDDARGLVCFKSAGKHEIRVAGRKLIGSAQRRTEGVFLQHGSILLGPAHCELPRYLKPGARGSEMTPAQLRAVTTGLQEQLRTTWGEKEMGEADDLLAAAFARELGLALEDF